MPVNSIIRMPRKTLLTALLFCLLSGAQALGDGIDVKVKGDWDESGFLHWSSGRTILPEDMPKGTFPLVFYLFAKPEFFSSKYCPDALANTVFVAPEYTGRLTVSQDKTAFFVPTDSPSGRYAMTYFSHELTREESPNIWLDLTLTNRQIRYVFAVFMAVPGEELREEYVPVLKNTAQFTCGEGISKDAKGVPIELDNPLPGMRLLERRAR